MPNEKNDVPGAARAMDGTGPSTTRPKPTTEANECAHTKVKPDFGILELILVAFCQIARQTLPF
jgi:hypothetical protein